MDNLIEYLVPILAVFLSYILGRLQNSNNERKKVLLKRYNQFYVPYIRNLYAGRMWQMEFSKISINTKGIFFDHIMKNIQYADISTQSLIPDFYKALLDVYEFDSGNRKYEGAHEILDVLFIKVTRSILFESINISKELKYPPIAKSLLPFFSEPENQ